MPRCVLDCLIKDIGKDALELSTTRLPQMGDNLDVALCAKIAAKAHPLYHSDLCLLYIILLYHYPWWIVIMSENLKKDFIFFNKKVRKYTSN